MTAIACTCVLGLDRRRSRDVIRTLLDLLGTAGTLVMPAESPDGVQFPVVGAEFAAKARICAGRIGDADAILFLTRDLVDFAKSYFSSAL